jgi:hypothetical protein
MTSTCKNICERFRSKGESGDRGLKAQYINGAKFCRCCNIFITPDGIYMSGGEFLKMRCACCKQLVRHKSQLKSFKKKYEELKKDGLADHYF